MLIVSFVSLSVCAGIKGRQTERRNPKTQWLQKERSLCSLQSQSGQSGRAGWLAYIWLLGHLLLLHPVDAVLWCVWFVQGFRGCLTPFLHTKEHVLTECLHSSLTNCKHVELKRCHKNIFMKFAIACVVFEIRLKTKKNMFMHGKQASINKTIINSGDGGKCARRETNCGLLHYSGVHTVSIFIIMEILNTDLIEIISDTAYLRRMGACWGKVKRPRN